MSEHSLDFPDDAVSPKARLVADFPCHPHRGAEQKPSKPNDKKERETMESGFEITGELVRTLLWIALDGHNCLKSCPSHGYQL